MNYHISMVAANAAYELDGGRRDALLAAAGLKETAYLQGAQDSRALVCEDVNGRQYLAFQGTQFTRGELPSIFANLEDEWVELNPASGAAVLRGYYTQYMDLLPEIEKLPSWKGAITVTGHSMGGVLASIYCAKNSLNPSSECYSFGAPKCGNAAFWNEALILPFRAIHSRDPAPLWPLMPIDAVHSSNAFAWFAGNGAAPVNCIRYPYTPDNPLDHQPAEYVAATLGF